MPRDICSMIWEGCFTHAVNSSGSVYFSEVAGTVRTGPIGETTDEGRCVQVKGRRGKGGEGLNLGSGHPCQLLDSFDAHDDIEIWPLMVHACCRIARQDVGILHALLACNFAYALILSKAWS